MAEPLNFLSQLTGFFSIPAAENPTVAMIEAAYRPWSLEGQRIELRHVAADIPTMDVGVAWNRHQPQSPATKTLHEFPSLSFSGAGHTV
jgi:hypothetical protein